MSEKSLKSTARNKALLAILMILGIVVAEVVAVLVGLLFGLEDGMSMQIIGELFGAIAAVAGVAMLGGAQMIAPSREDVSYTFRFAWWCLAVTVGLLVYEMIDYIASGTAINPDWPTPMLQTAVLCLLIGIFEEFLFRGIVFQAFLGLMGGTHRGVVRAVIFTSIIFGLAHVDFSEFTDGLSIVQALLKITQTGLYSLLLCTIVLRTHKLGGVSLFHGFDDFLIIAPSVGLYNESLEIDYVVSGEDALPTIMYYLLVIALYIPFVVKSVRDIRREQYVYRGAFMEKAVEEERLAAEREAQMAAERLAWERAQLAEAQAAMRDAQAADGGAIATAEMAVTTMPAQPAQPVAGPRAGEAADLPMPQVAPTGWPTEASAPAEPSHSRAGSSGRPPRPSGL